jgi:hypothetical protein
MGEKTSTWKFMMREPEGNRLFGRPGRRWEKDVKIYARLVVCVGVSCLHLTEDKCK